MNELVRHIESLLVTNDCVIVPGLGGFVTQHVSARRVEEENLFLPPYRTVGFNAQLTMNDGLLAQSFMQSHDATYPETVRLIENLVMDVKHELREKGLYELEGIGQLLLKYDGSYDFVPCEAGVLSPEHYGLGSFVVETLAEIEEAKEAKAEPVRRRRPARLRRRRDYVVRINRNAANYVLAAAAAVVLYFFFSMPMGYRAGDRITMASVSNGMVWGLPGQSEARPQCRPVEPVVTPQPEAKPMQPKAVVPAPKKPVIAEKPVSPQPSAAYTIVLASAITEENARRLTEEVNRGTAQKASVYKKGRMVRVVYGGYATKEEAQTELKRLRAGDGFSDSWVMALKR